MKTIKHLLISAILVLPTFANASTFTGIPANVRVGVGTLTSSTRVSINVAPHGSPCVYSDWFAYENATNNTEKLWTEGALNSVGRRYVTIYGTVLCDQYGVETIRAIDFK